jgi:hypothetical protein
MSTLSLRLPDSLHTTARSLAKQEHVSPLRGSIQ